MRRGVESVLVTQGLSMWCANLAILSFHFLSRMFSASEYQCTSSLLYQPRFLPVSYEILLARLPHQSAATDKLQVTALKPLTSSWHHFALIILMKKLQRWRLYLYGPLLPFLFLNLG